MRKKGHIRHAKLSTKLDPRTHRQRQSCRPEDRLRGAFILDHNTPRFFTHADQLVILTGAIALKSDKSIR